MPVVFSLINDMADDISANFGVWSVVYVHFHMIVAFTNSGIVPVASLVHSWFNLVPPDRRVYIDMYMQLYLLLYL